ncbi:MAG: hypothetical protein SVM80_11085 [Halobacteriota archaeon]|nr:hypothetical protein [Halobacteriota archaeon]
MLQYTEKGSGGRPNYFIELGHWDEDTNWHISKVVKDGYSWELFMDGVSKGTATQPVNFSPNSFLLRSHSWNGANAGYK